MSVVIVTVAIPTYNAARTIGECLRSLEAQDFPRNEMEIIVGDNSSTDNTVQIIADSFPRVEVVTALERGSGFARNAAISVARGRYICSIDADCVADPGWVSAMVHAFNESPESVVCLGGQILPYRTETVVERYRPAWIQQENLRKGEGDFSYAETTNAAFRRSMFARVGFFDGKMGFEDADMGLRLKVAGGLEVRYIPNAIVRHRNPASISELYRHRMKYAGFMVRLSSKHPNQFCLLNTPSGMRRLTMETVRRIVGDLTYKVPYALMFGGDSYGTRLWPLLDAVIAVSNYVGVYRAVYQSR